MADSRDHLDLQRRYQEMINEFDEIDSQLVQKALSLCTKFCIGNNSSTAETVNACVVKCGQSLPQLNQAVQQELTNLQAQMQLCALDCSDKMAATVPPGTKEGDPAMQRGVVQNTACTANCATQSVPLVEGMYSKITAAAYRAGKMD